MNCTVPAGEILMLNGVMDSRCCLDVFRFEVIVRGFSERLFQDCGEGAALHAVGVEDIDRHLTGSADADFDL